MELAKRLRRVIEKTTQGGHIVTITFVKKDGSVRRMNGRPSDQIKKGKTGVGMAYDPKEYNLIPFLDMDIVRKETENLRKEVKRDPTDRERDQIAKKAFRMINLETVTEIRGEGKILYSKIEVIS